MVPPLSPIFIHIGGSKTHAKLFPYSIPGQIRSLSGARIRHREGLATILPGTKEDDFIPTAEVGLRNPV
jgi:hypothetical protein